MNWYLSVLKKYAVFTGRARRQEYWMFLLFNIIIMVVLAVIEVVIGTWGILGMVYALAVLLPSIGVTIRRLHDTGRAGWWILIALVPAIGYEKASAIAKEALESGRGVYELVLEQKILSREALDKLLNPDTMTGGGSRR